MKQFDRFRKILSPVFCFIVICSVLLCCISPVFALSGRSHTYIYECPYTFAQFSDGTSGYYFDLLSTSDPGTMWVVSQNWDTYEFYNDAGDLWDEFVFRKDFTHRVYYETPTFYVDEVFPFAGESVIDCQWVFSIPVTIFSGSLRFSGPYISFFFYDANGNMFRSVWEDFVDEPVTGSYMSEYHQAIFTDFPSECYNAAYFHIEVGYTDVTVVDSTYDYVEKSVALSKFQYFLTLESGSLAEMIIKNELANYEDQLQADQFGDRVDDYMDSMSGLGGSPVIDWNQFNVEDIVSGDAFTNINAFLGIFYDSSILSKLLVLLSGLILVSYILFASKGV